MVNENILRLAKTRCSRTAMPTLEKAVKGREKSPGSTGKKTLYEKREEKRKAEKKSTMSKM